MHNHHDSLPLLFLVLFLSLLLYHFVLLIFLGHAWLASGYPAKFSFGTSASREVLDGDTA